MDRVIDRRSRLISLAKRGFAVFAVVAAVSAIYLLASGWIQPTIERSTVQIARVDDGPIEATMSASGTVVPEFEGVLSSPLDARVLKILKRAGSPVRKGEPIISLDVSESELAVERANQKLLQKGNEQEQKRLALDSKLVDLRKQKELKEVDVRSLGLTYEKQQRMREAGLNSAEQLRQAAVDLEKAQIEAKQLAQSILASERETKSQIEGLQLEFATLRKEKDESARQLELATTKSDRDGVLTWVVQDEGSVVRKNDVIARVADLRSFRVQATLPDVHSTRVSAGLPARVKVNDTVTLDGRVASIMPAIKDGVATLFIDLDNPDNALLRSNLRVDAYIVVARKARVIRVARGAFANGEGVHDVFVVRGNKAVRTPVQLGLFGFERCEAIRGLVPGDEVITSDMKDYAHLKTVDLK
jgi:HlyD family secretion protein